MIRKTGRNNGRDDRRMLPAAAVFALVLAAAASEAYAGTWRQTDSGWY